MLRPSHVHAARLCRGDALGLALPGSALLPAGSPELTDMARRAGALSVSLADTGLKPSDIVTMDSFENAILVHAAISGSTNCLLHLPAIAHELGLTLRGDDFDRLHRGMPFKFHFGGDPHLGYPLIIGIVLPACVDLTRDELCRQRPGGLLRHHILALVHLDHFEMLCA